jgi:coproporphyrinogen III oxidase-like Fe-S oxidoreductase
MEKGISARDGCEELTPYDQMKECVLFGLRMNRGVELEAVARRYGCFLTEEQKQKIDDLIRGGYLVRRQGLLMTSAKGRMVLDELCVQLV